MAVLKCKMCGGELILVEGSCIAECEYCGTRQTVPSADNEKKLNLFARANRLRAGNEFDKAAGVYESIVTDFPEEAEAYWGLILCKYGIEYVDDPGTGKKIPTCHRSSFNSLMDDPDFDLVMEYADSIARKVYREEAKQIEELRKGIIEVSSKEEPYDIFICYKETDEEGQRTLDSVLAQDIYDMLTENGYRVFFSRISLEDKLGVEYEPYIFAALNSARIMLAVGTDYDYYNAVWVKNEWSRFLQLIAKGEKKTLIPCFKNIDAYDMPKEFAKLQAQDLGKIGALQDLLRGIGKILPKKDGIQSGAAPQTASLTAPLLRRVGMSLEDGEWTKADDLCEQVLNQEPENAHAYLGKLMAEFHVRKQSDLATCGKQYIHSSNYQKALRFSDSEFKAELEKYASENIAYLPQTPEAAFTFSANNNGYSVTELIDKKLIDIVIPRTHQGKPVTAIGANAFGFCENLISVTIPDSVIDIGEKAFQYCDNLSSVTIPASVTTIGKEAFYVCKSLTSITLPDGVTTIGEFAFNSCTSLTSLSLPDSVTFIGNGAFRGCEKLADKNGFIIKKGVLHSYCGSSKSVTIPDSVTVIGSRAFMGCKSLIGLAIPNSVTTIGGDAFNACTSLTSITIPDSVTTIGEGAFWGCEKLADKNGFVILKDVLYSYYGSSDFVTIPDSVTAIGSNAFMSKELTGVTIPDSVTAIGNGAFSFCKNLSSVTIPDSVTIIGDNAFTSCKSLASIMIPNSVTAIGSGAFNSCESLTNVKISDSITVIEKGTFSSCKNLVNITIPDSVITIGEIAFYECKSLARLTVPDSVTTIGNNAFSSSGLVSITIPDSVTTIGFTVFLACNNLKTIICRGDYEKLKSVFKRNNARDENIFVCLERGAEEEKRLLMESRRAHGLCLYCGGTFKKNLFSSVCTNCGRKKDY